MRLRPALRLRQHSNVVRGHVTIAMLDRIKMLRRLGSTLSSARPSVFYAAVLLFALAAVSSAQTKLAIVNFQDALLATADMQKESAELEAKYRTRQEELSALGQELQDIQSKLQTAAGAEAQRLQEEGQRKQIHAQRLNEDLQSDVEFDRQNILASASERMRGVLRELRVERGLDLILDSATVLASDALIDLTAEATRAYDAKHPSP